MKRLFIFLTILTTIIPPKITASTIEGEYFQIESAHCHWDECEFLRIDGKNIVLGLNEERLVFEKVDQVIRFAGSIWYQSSVINEHRKLAINGYLSSDGVLSVHFVGKEDISSYYVNSKVFVLPSKSEPWGLVVNEAMMCGLPVVVSSHCGCSLDLVDGNGYVFKPNNTNSLSSILESYMRNDNDISAQRELSLSIISQYTPDIAASKLVGIFDKNKLR